MIEQKKRPAAGTVGRKTTTKVAATGTFSVARVTKACKCFVYRMGCFFAALAAFMFFVAPFEPGEMSLSAGWVLAGVAAWLCRELYRMAGGDE